MAARGRPSRLRERSNYFEAALAAIVAAVAADEAASAADEAAIIDEVAAEAVSAGAGVTTVVVAGAGVVVVVVVSSFLEQAAKETAAASVTISRAVFIFLLGDLGFVEMTGLSWEPSREEPHRGKTRKAGGIPMPSPRL